jgi:benzoylformate decarboxylase
MQWSLQKGKGLNEIWPANTIVVNESPSNLPDFHAAWRISKPDTFYNMASGMLAAIFQRQWA